EYPWGAEWNPARANANEGGIGRTTAVGMYPLGVPTPWPVLDLAGNVWEWCMNEQRTPANIGSDEDARLVVRGGAWHDESVYSRTFLRGGEGPSYSNYDTGFRVCRGSPPIETLATASLAAEGRKPGPPQR
ncbi:MAG: SUMF1/EgtB/PvdO family nonheme iron enzyme, partial [Rhodocyclaceae bacterium]|nr:SUMF1/EgtB/PvdO family nonheme iron enzyme [Rhodocyclaceae bacterium]